MNGAELYSYLKSCRITKQYFKGVYPSDKIPSKFNKYPCFVIANTEESTKDGEHWIVLFYLKSDTVEVFDSLGSTPYAYITVYKYLMRNFKNITYTDKQLQSLKSNVCGLHCLFFCYKKCKNKIPLALIIRRYYTSNENFNDCNVIHFCKIKFKVKNKILCKLIKTTSCYEYKRKLCK